MTTLYYLGNSRSPEQAAEMVRLEEAGTCLFCPTHLLTSDKVIVHQSPNWVVTTNDFPYAGTREHFLLVPHQHVEDLTELEPGVWLELQRVFAWVKQRYNLTYYSQGSRNGNAAYTGATIRHLHFHLVVGDPDQPDTPVRFRMSSVPGREPGPSS